MQFNDNNEDLVPKSFFRNLITKVFHFQKTPETVRETLEELIEEREEAETPIDEHEKRLLANILSLHDRTAKDVMIPRANIVGLNMNTSQEEFITIVQETGHSRYPVFRDNLDHTIGLIHIQDVLIVIGEKLPFSLQTLIRQILFIAPSVRVPDLLLEMRNKKTHMALVVDEYGGIDGLVTIEDLVEQIVGDIQDEHDPENVKESPIIKDGAVEINAGMLISEFENLYGPLSLTEELNNFDTMGGLVYFLAGRIPSRGELVLGLSSIEFEVVDADPRRIKRLRVHNLFSGVN
jgi:CBS domain containing-hemolysin-like protein